MLNLLNYAVYTGDETQIWLYAAIAAVVLISVVVLLVVTKPKPENDKNNVVDNKESADEKNENE